MRRSLLLRFQFLIDLIFHLIECNNHNMGMQQGYRPRLELQNRFRLKRRNLN